MLVLIIGPMFGGKSTYGVLDNGRDLFRGKKCLTVKHKIDDRHVDEVVVTHNGLKSQADSIVTPDLTSINVDNYDSILVEEIQFFDNYEVVIDWARDKKVICTGLNGDVNARPFDAVTKLAPHAIIKTREAVCEKCGKNAIYTVFRNVSDYIPTKENVVKVGGKECFMTVCNKCRKEHLKLIM